MACCCFLLFNLASAGGDPIRVGQLDEGFRADVAGQVTAIAIQNDGKIIVSGFLPRGVTRLNRDGSTDTSFTPGLGAEPPTVRTVLLQRDGKIVVGGHFTTFNGVSRNGIARLNVDGSLDDTFNAGPGIGGVEDWSGLPGVYAAAIDSKGKIVIGGDYRFFTDLVRTGVLRLNPNGTLDSSFTGSSYAPATVLAVQADDKVVVVGFYSGREAHLVLVGGDGTGFSSPGFAGPSIAHSLAYITALNVQRDGKILVGGSFVTADNFQRPGLARLNSDGSLDSSFEPQSGGSQALAVQDDGKILTADYNTVQRLNSNGSLDSSFDAGSAAGTISTLALQSDGKILVGGLFTAFNGHPAYNIVRLLGDGALKLTASWSSNRLDISFSTEAARIYWLEFKDKLSDRDWQTLSSVTGLGDSVVLSDTNTWAHQRFYRVQLNN